MKEEHDTFIEWIEKTPMTARLKNTLKRYRCTYLEDTRADITKEKFLAMHGVGKGQWNEFQELLS